MPSKKHGRNTPGRSTHTGQHKHSQVKNAPNNKHIQIAALIVIAITVVALVWMVVYAQKPRQNATAQSTGELPKLVATKQYDSAPPMLIDKTKKYSAVVKMAKGGEFTIELYPDKAPLAVNSFVFLARQGYFDGVTFHRVLEGFMAQGGDPTGTGKGGPGYKFANEDSDLTFDKAGVVAMANSGRDTNGSQFFITFAPVPHLNGGYTIFGQVTSGMDVVNNIKRRNPDEKPNFTGDAIETITINEQ